MTEFIDFELIHKIRIGMLLRFQSGGSKRVTWEEKQTWF